MGCMLITWRKAGERGGWNGDIVHQAERKKMALSLLCFVSVLCWVLITQIWGGGCLLTKCFALGIYFLSFFLSTQVQISISMLKDTAKELRDCYISRWIWRELYHQLGETPCCFVLQSMVFYQVILLQLIFLRIFHFHFTCHWDLGNCRYLLHYFELV